MIDCHTHLTHADFDADRAAVLRRAAQAGVTHVAIVGQDGDENEQVLRLARAGVPGLEPGQGVVWLPFLGLHPDRFADRAPPLPEAQVTRVCEQVRAHRNEIVGIGEVGLDYWLCQDEGRRALQRAAFARLMDLALELDLPLNVHSRSAGHHTLDLLRERG
ncbi:MAG TPA: TatD family hydrolase, partial [bacterium]|nr:TatD family hydrolase [bacterium]